MRRFDVMLGFEFAMELFIRTFRDAIDVHAIYRILHDQDLYRAQGGEQMRVVVRVGTEPS